MKAYTNGKIYTVNENRDWAEAVVIDGNRIAYVGDNAGAAAFIEREQTEGRAAEVVDLEGKLMLPGLIDGHCHPVMGAFFKSGVVLNGIYTLEGMQEEIRKHIEAHPGKKYYHGKGFQEEYFIQNGIWPDKSMLDCICDDVPVFIYGTSGHVAWCNSCALEKAGITADTPDPHPGRSYFARDEEGNPTGYLVENMAASTVSDRVEVIDEEEVNASMLELSEEYAANGVTGLCDMGGLGEMLNYMKDGFLDFVKSGKLKQRFSGCGVMVNSIGEVDDGIALAKELCKRAADKKVDNDQCRFSFVKMFQDGTLEDLTAAISAPYLNIGTAPKSFFTDEEMIEAGKKIAEAGFDINVHCIGDMAAHGLVVMTQSLRDAGFNDTRVTDSHSTYIHKGDVPKFGKLGILANTTFVWHAAFEEEKGILPPELPPMYELKSVLKGGAKIGAGSDYPTDDFGLEPMKGLQMGCTRKMYREDLYPSAYELAPASEKLSMDDVITAYTISNAYQMRMEDKIGSIEVGKYADMIVLDQNVFEIPIEEVYRTRVCETIMNGETTYKG
ncbi:MAG: amidohydrolase [Firmicutes bacterium]|nr:amidohydrolase [Bacillota bacterium]